MKKLFFKGCLCCFALLISSVLSYAVTDNVPKKINVQGKLTTDSGQPITGNKTIKLYIYDTDSHSVEKEKTVNVDSDGLYSVNFDVDDIDFNGQYSFQVEAGGVLSPKESFAASPYSFHSSTATYALVLSPNGEKLVNENFDSDYQYKINVDTTSYAVEASSISSNGESGQVWGMNGSNQSWIDVSSLSISSATTDKIGGLMLGVEAETGLNMDEYGVLKVTTAPYTTKAKELDSSNNGVKLVDGNFITITDNPDNIYNIKVGTASYAVEAGSLSGSFKLTDDNFDNTRVYLATTSWASNAVTVEDGAITTIKVADANITPAKLTQAEYGNPYDIKVSSSGWADTAGVAESARAINADLAEIYKSTEDLQPGDVVSIDTTKDNSIVKTRTAEDTLVAGVISTEPGLLLNSAEKGYKLALVGKVPTKVCNESGDIKRGDLLVSASIAGYAKKAGDNPKAGTVIGKALENFSSKRGTILVLVNLQ